MNLGVDGIYVITLDRLHVRKKHMIDLSEKIGCNFNFISGIDAKQYSSEFIRKHINEDDGFFDPNAIYNDGVICCALSHRKAWKAFLDSEDDIALFLEDDVVETEMIHTYDFKSIRAQLDTINSLNWGVCWYGKYYEDILIKTTLTNDIGICELFNPIQYAGHAYVLNRKSAEWFYKNTKSIRFAADIQLEISPFTMVSLKKSVFIQKGKGIVNEYVDPEFIISNTVSIDMFNIDKKTGEFSVKPPNGMNLYNGTIHHNDKRIQGAVFKNC